MLRDLLPGEVGLAGRFPALDRVAEAHAAAIDALADAEPRAGAGTPPRTRMPMRTSAIAMPSMRMTMIVVSAPSRSSVACT